MIIKQLFSVRHYGGTLSMSPKAEKVTCKRDWKMHSLGLVLKSVSLDLNPSWPQGQSQESTGKRMAEARVKRTHRNPSFV